jgi:hypothetical protein
VLVIGLVRDHVHMVVRAHPGTSISRLVQRCKGGSSYLAGKERARAPGAVLRWAKGYTIESVSPRALATARAYVRRQPSHHPALAISGWEGDTPQYDTTGLDEWVGPGRFRVRGSPTARERDASHQFTG